LAFAFFSWQISAQCGAYFEVTSSQGYTVHVEIVAKSIIPSVNPCPWGYNYNVAFDYNVSFSGSNIPSSLWTLQGNMPCIDHGSNTFDLPNSGGIGTSMTGGNVTRNNTDCATATPISLNCQITLIIQGPGISDELLQHINSDCLSNAPLPVELISFNAMKEERFVNLTWSTATELNNDFFEIQKSTDGTNWNVIGKIEGAGTTTTIQNYEFQDITPNTFSLVYYRLRQVDFDGSENFSEIQSVELTPVLWTLFPNPTSNQSVLISAEPIALESITMYDFTGRALPKNDIFHKINDSTVVIDISQMKSGIYMISVNDQTQKLIVN